MLKLWSSAFDEGHTIPPRFTCDGEDVSPPLQWEGVPEETRSFTLIVDDPDAPRGTWVHWVLYNIPAESRGLGEGMPTDPELTDGTRSGMNSWGRSRAGYGGPCPPSGTHRYFFKLYALDRKLEVKPGATSDQLAAAMEGHIIADAFLMGRYSRT